MKEYRPWGWYDVLHESIGCKVKKIHVNPRSRLSLQSHRFRREIWVCIRGEGRAQIDDSITNLTVGTTVDIPQGARHRLDNPSDSFMEIIETQLGDYFGEDDITRYEDDYGR